MVIVNSFHKFFLPDKIKDLLSQDAVGSLTKLVLVNAIYFKGSWNTQFKEEKTADAQFRLNKVTVQKGSIGWCSYTLICHTTNELWTLLNENIKTGALRG